MTKEERHAKQLEWMRKWREAHPDYNREYHRAHKEHIKKTSRAYYLNHREALLIRCAEYRAKKRKERAGV